MQKRFVVFFFAALLVALLSGPFASAQSNGTVGGSVKDPQGSAVPEAKVVLNNTATNAKAEAVTNADGRFVFGYVVPANYTLIVQKGGFKALSVPVTVQVAQVLDLNLTLELGQISETVTVVETSVVINTTNGELSHEISG